MILKLLILLGAVIALSEGTYIKKRVVKAYCARSWIFYKNNCYLFSRDSRNRSGASKYCRAKGASLVKISSKGEGIWLSNKAKSRSKNFNKSYWIFPTCVKKYYKCVWGYGGLKYRGWKNGQPGKGNQCAALFCGYKWAHWKSLNCQKSNLYICKKAANERVVRPVLVIDEPFPDSSSESGSSGSSSSSKKGKKYRKKGRGSGSHSSGGKKKRRHHKKGGSSDSSSSSKKGKKYRKKGRHYKKGGKSSDESSDKKKKY